MKWVRVCFLLLFSIFVFRFGFAVEKIWDGEGDGSSWSDPLNWSYDKIPFNGDEVYLESVSDIDKIFYDYTSDLYSEAYYGELWFENTNPLYFYIGLRNSVETINLQKFYFSGAGKTYYYQKGHTVNVTWDAIRIYTNNPPEKLTITLTDGAVLYPSAGILLNNGNDIEISVIDSTLKTDSQIYLANTVRGTANFYIRGDSNVISKKIVLSRRGNIFQTDGAVEVSSYIYDKGLYKLLGGSLTLDPDAGYLAVVSNGAGAGGFIMDNAGTFLSVPFIWVASSSENDPGIFLYEGGDIAPVKTLGVGYSPYVGRPYYGRFIFKADGKTLDVESLQIGANQGHGSFEMHSPTSKLDVERSITIGASAYSSGSFYQYAGTVSASGLHIGYLNDANWNERGYGHYIISDGALNITGSLTISGYMAAGVDNHSYVEQRGGMVNIGEDLSFFGSSSYNSALYVIRDGSLNVGRDILLGQEPYNSGSLYITGTGCVTVNGDVKLVEQARLTLNSGLLRSPNALNPYINTLQIFGGSYYQYGGVGYVDFMILGGGISTLLKSNMLIAGGDLHMHKLRADAAIFYTVEVNQKGGTISDLSEVDVEDKAQLNVSGGTFDASKGIVIVRNGSTFKQTGGTVQIGRFLLGTEEGNSLLAEMDVEPGAEFKADSVWIYRDGLFKHRADVEVCDVNLYGDWDGKGRVGGEDIFFRDYGDVFVGGKDEAGLVSIWGGKDAVFIMDKGALFFDLAGYERGLSYDFLEVLGDVGLLSGDIYINLLNDFDPTAGSIFDLVWAERTFKISPSDVVFHFPIFPDDRYFDWWVEDDTLRIGVKEHPSTPPPVAPEPMTGLLFCIGVIGVGLRQRKQKNLNV